MVSIQEFKIRRKNLIKALPSRSVVLIPAAYETWRNGDAHHRFRQDSDFYYLTGFNEPNALLVISSDNPDGILFNAEHNKTHEIWTGKRLGVEDAPQKLGVRHAFALEKIDEMLPDLLAENEQIYYPIGRYPLWEKRILCAWQIVKDKVRRGVRAPMAFCDITPPLSEMRLFKSKDEIALMRHAMQATVSGHQKAMALSRKASYEYHLEAELLHEFIRHGCRSVAYDSIVAGGNRACTLHYTQNNESLNPNELVLIDAGAEYENYAADVTRTFPSSGRFSAPQRQIYELVLTAQKRAMECIKPGAYWNDMQDAIVHVLTQGLIDLGILKGQLNALIEQEAYKAFYMHNSGHWLGLDVHDCGQYKLNAKWRALEPGMVLTVEPGLYISNDAPVDEKWRGIGIRIEDDILVTENGYENLTQALMTDPDEIEAWICG